MHALVHRQLRDTRASHTLPRSQGSSYRPVATTARQQRRTAPTAAAARLCCCSASKPVPGLSAQPTLTVSSKRGSKLVARDSPYRGDSGSNTSDDGSSRQQHEPGHPDRFHELPPDASLEMSGSTDTPAHSSSSSDSTLEHLKAVLPSGAAAQGSTPQAIAAAQALQRGEGLPKRVTAPAGQKLQAQLEDMASKYQALDARLDSLEGSLVSLLRSVKERAARPAAAAAVGPGGEAAADGSVVAVAAAGEVELPEGELAALGSYEGGDDDDHGGLFDLKKLQTSLAENINRGYLESVKHLREMLMAYEWHLHGKELAERRGVALFERHCAEHELGVGFDTITALYQDPNDLSVLQDDKLKLLARSIIQTAVDERYCSIYYECTATAKELAHTGLKDVIPDSAGKVGGVIKDILPLPGFLKK